MKVFNVIEIRQDDGEPDCLVWRVLPDSVLMKGHNPFFVPEFDCRVNAYPAVALRLSRLGKYVEPRFASRYFSQMAPAVVFRADSLGEDLRAAGLPDDQAYCFDQAVALGDFADIPDPLESIGVSLRCGNSLTEHILETPASLFAEAVATVSRRNTLKMGDLIICASPPAGIPALPDSFQEAALSISANNINHRATLRLTVK